LTISRAESFCDYYHDLIAKPPNKLRESIGETDRRSLDVVLRSLCRFAVGPYGAAEAAYRLIARMATLAPEVLSEEVSRNAISTQLVRSLESAVRQYHVNARLWRTFSELLVKPPDLLISKIYWLPALRRLLIADRKRRVESDLRRWPIEQLKIALRGEGSYENSSATDRRFALWCLAELVENDGEWAQIESNTENDPMMADLIETCRQFRLSPRIGFEGFSFTPRSGWSRPRSMVEILDAGRSRSRSWSVRELWRSIRPPARERLVGFLEDALLAPNFVRQRAATHLLRASGDTVRTAVSVTVSQLVDLERTAGEPRVDVLERCFRVIGAMGQESSIPVVERFIRERDSDPLVMSAAIGAAGDLAYRHPRKAVGMMAWVNDAISTSTTRTRAIIGIRASTAFGKDPRSFFEFIPENGDPSIVRCLDWSHEVLHDPLWTPRT